MRKTILLTNDDGIQAESLQVLRDALSPFAHCIIVAPIDQKSASAHAISIVHDIEVSKYHRNDAFFGYQVKGTPADCVKIALCEIMNEMPHLIISGINIGPNTGVSIYYSGTVSAAREGTIAGVPSIAASMCSFEYRDYTYAVSLIARIAERVLKHGLPEGVTLNINIPPLKSDEIRGVKITKQARSRFIEKYTRTQEDGECVRYSLSGEMEVIDHDPHNDEQTIKNGYVSITPLKLDLTAGVAMDSIATMLE